MRKLEKIFSSNYEALVETAVKRWYFLSNRMIILTIGLLDDDAQNGRMAGMQGGTVII